MRPRRAHLSTLLALTLVGALTISCAAWVPSFPGSTAQVSTGGFGSQANSYAWSMASFNGKLYVGTARAQRCVERATLDYFLPGQDYYKSDAEATCPADKYDLELQAEIWEYTSATGVWRLAYRAPADIPNPRSPGKFLSRDIGYRGMVVFEGALYVLGVSSDEYIPELFATNPPRILRTTDGESFTAIDGGPTTIETSFGTQKPMGFRSFATLNGHLYVTASGGLTGDGAAVEVIDPAGPNPTFVQVSPPGVSVYEIEGFNDRLYLGIGTATTGYAVMRSDTNAPPLQYTTIVDNAAGRGKDVTSVVSMEVFKDKLYVGSSGWGTTLFPASELLRINPDDSWELVVGNDRTLADGTLVKPVSGLPDGFGNAFNGHFWRQQDYNGALYLGTNDWSHALKDVPVLSDLLKDDFGFDMYASCDGAFWWTVTRNGFGDGIYNYGARTLAVNDGKGYIGSANHFQGTAIWENKDPSPCGATASSSFLASVSPVVAEAVVPPAPPVANAVPQRLVADPQPCATVLSWDPEPDSTRHKVLRAPRRTISGVPALKHPPTLGAGGVPDDPPALAAGITGTGTVETIGAFETVGATTGTSFVDTTAVRGQDYVYQVTNVTKEGTGSGFSAVAISTPSEQGKHTRLKRSRQVESVATTCGQ